MTVQISRRREKFLAIPVQELHSAPFQQILDGIGNLIPEGCGYGRKERGSGII